jgi:hypothetical protein
MNPISGFNITVHFWVELKAALLAMEKSNTLQALAILDILIIIHE